MRWDTCCLPAEAADTIRAIGRLVAPNLCEACGDSAPESRPLCPSCESKLTPARCGIFPTGGLPAFVAYEYTGPAARSLMQRFKYRGIRRLADYLALSIARRWRWSELPVRDVLLIPVPMSRARRRERGYNQAELLATALGSRLRLAACDLMVRRRSAQSQTRLSEREREENIRRAFGVRQATPYRPVVIIDDVWTTGATLRACRETLQSAGHSVVACAAAFWTPPKVAVL